MSKKQKPSTACVHAGGSRSETTFSITPPIVHSAPFSFASTRELLDFMEGRSPRTQAEYGRMSNPTVTEVERRLAALEGAEKAQLFASGMAAVTSLFVTLLKAGDRIILTNDCYRRTRDFGRFLSRFGVDLSIVQPATDSIEEAITSETRLIFTEIPTNPYLHCVDLQEIIQVAHERDVIVIADSTFATPINLRPLALGADFVIHSATKYLGGHNDLIAGIVAGSHERVEPISEMLMTLGGISDPNTAFLLGRGLKTLEVRVRRQNSSGIEIARFLESHPAIEKVWYPGLLSHPSHETAVRLMSGFGGVVTFLVKGGFEATSKFIDGLQIPHIAPSLGGVESLVEQVAIMSFWNLTPKQRSDLGIPDNLVRLAVGIEDTEDLIADLRQSLEAR